MKSTKAAKGNPFCPSFGSIPVALAGREKLIDDILEGLDNAPGDPNRASIFVGPRGSGKTVLIAEIADRAEQNGWLAVNINAEEGMLEELLVQVRDRGSHILKKQTVRRLSGLQVAGVGITVETKERRSTWRSELTSVIKELNDHGTGLLITVDEVSTKYDELRILVNCFQHFVREKRDVALLLAGLPGQVSMLLRDDKVSFLRRAFQHAMDSIEITEVIYAMKETIEAGGRTIETAALHRAAEAAGGFAFLIQLIGYHIWRVHPQARQIRMDDVEEGIILAAHDMDHMIFDAVAKEITPKENAYLYAMLEDSEVSRVSDLIQRLKMSQNSAAQLRRSLIERGVIEERGRGRVALAIPFFREYLERHRPG